LSATNLLHQQTAVITGAAHGLGLATALAMAEAGAAVVINDLEPNMDAAKAAVQQIEKAGGRAITVAGDVSREADVQALFARAIDAFGTIHILFSNAGIQRDAPLVDMTLAQWQKVIDVNLTGQFLCAREAAREFLRREVPLDISRARGKILCMSSVHQAIPWACHVNYAASKGGVAMMMSTLAQELGPRGIRVNSIAPGAIRTDINRMAWGTPEGSAALMTLIPYGRIGEPVDIARAAVWLASDQADYVHGATLVVDGGMMLYPGFRGNG
jgi:glucose 1-dehydrogenase